MKFKIILTIALTFISGNALAAFVYQANHPSGEEITNLVAFAGGVYAGHDSVSTFPIYRYDPATRTHTLEETLNAASASRVFVTPSTGTRAPTLVILGDKPTPANTGDLMAVRLGTANVWGKASNANVNLPNWLMTNVQDAALVGSASPTAPGSYSLTGKNLNTGAGIVLNVQDPWATNARVTARYGGSTSNPESFCLYFTSPSQVPGTYAPAIGHGRNDSNCAPLSGHAPNQIQSSNHIPLGSAFSSFGANGLPITETIPANRWTFTIQGGELYKHLWTGTDWRHPVLAYNKPVHDIIEYKERLIFLDIDGKVCYSATASSWKCIDQAPLSARQITIDQDNIYVGTTDGEIWSAPNSLRNLTMLSAPGGHTVSP